MKFTLSTALTLGILFCSSLTAQAFAQSPDEIAKEIIQNIRKERNLEAVSKYLDWEGAYEAIDPEERKQMNYKSVEKYKEHQLQALQGQTEEIKESVERARRSASGRHQQLLNMTNDSMSKTLEEKRAVAEKAFAETVYSVGKTQIDGDKATVTLSRVRSGAETTKELTFKKVNGKWKLTSGAAFNPMDGSSGSKLQGLLGPPLVTVAKVLM
jgi:hypothetical protein